MSAESPRKAYKYTCNMIRPQAYSERSLMESVVDFFSDVVPQAYTGSPRIDDKEKIQWVRFEDCDCNDIAKNPDLYKSDTKGLPLLLILGYSNGVQIWYITPNGEAQEILSIRQGPVRLFRVLPTPDSALGYSDMYASKRPLAVMCDSSSAGQPYCSVKFVSLRTGDEIHSINYKTLTVQNVECNKRFLVTVFHEKVCVYDSCQFKQLFWITSCYPCPGPNVNPIALSTRWLAYADKRLVPMHQSCGGMSGDGSQSYAATVISAAKGAFKGLSMFGEAMVSSMTGNKPTYTNKCWGGAFKGLSMFGEAMVSSVTGNKPTYTNKKVEVGVVDNGDRPGIISVVDLQNIHNDHFNVTEDSDGDGLIAHFHAHANEPVANMAFDSSGTLLVTACKLGHNFHIFRLMAHPCNSSLGAVHHLYTLHRGDTTAKVIDISFNHDTRWVTVSTHRGTTHLFPITPYGGSVNVRTHCQPHVVNRASRFHKSAGLDEIEHNPVGRRSPVLSSSPGSSGQYDRYPSLIQQNTLNNNMGNPRLPPYPHPITIYPAYQIKQPLNVSMNPGNKNNSPTHSPTGVDNIFAVTGKFGTPRMCVVGSPKLGKERRESGKRPVDSLFILAQSGTLVEYLLEPKARISSDKVTDESILELGVTGRMQWNLQRLKNSPEQRPPLPSNSPLVLAKEAVATQIPTAPDLFDLPGLTRHDSKDSLSSDHSGKDENDEQWLSQVEIITHAGPHRRLWMGPQFSFKTYQNTTVLSSNSSSLLSQSPESNMAAMDIAGDEGDLESLKVQPARSNPVSMPTARPAYRRLSGSDSSPTPTKGGQMAPLMIEAGSYDQSPHLCDVYSNWTESSVAKQPHLTDDLEEDKLKETLADAMVESPIKDAGKGIVKQEIARSEATIEEVQKEPTGKVAEKKERNKERGKKQKESPMTSDKEKCRKTESSGLGRSKIDENDKSSQTESCDKQENVRKDESTDFGRDKKENGKKAESSDLGRDKTDKKEKYKQAESSGFGKDESDKKEKDRKVESLDFRRDNTYKKENGKKVDSSGSGRDDKKEKNRRSGSSGLLRDQTQKKENDKKAESSDFGQSGPSKKKNDKKAESSEVGKDETNKKEQNKKVESTNFGTDKTDEDEKVRKSESSDIAKDKIDKKEKNRKPESTEFRGDKTDYNEKNVKTGASGLRNDQNKKNQESDFGPNKTYKTEESETSQDVVTGNSLKGDDATMEKSTTTAVKKKSKANKSPTQDDVSSNTWKGDDSFSTEKSTAAAGKKNTKQNKKSPTQDVVSTGTLKDDDNISMEKLTTTSGNKKKKETEQSPKQSEEKQDSALPSSQENSYPIKGNVSPKDDNLMSKEKDTNMNTPKCNEVLSSGSITDTEVKCVETSEVPLSKSNLKCSESESERNEAKPKPISFASKVTNEAKQIPISFASKVATSNKQTSLTKENYDDKNGESEEKRTNPWKMPWKVSDSGSDIKSKLSENTEQLATKGFAKDDFQDENDYKLESKQQSKTQSNEKNLNESKTVKTKTEPPTAIKFSDVCKPKKKSTAEKSPPSEQIPSLSDLEAPDISTETDVNVSVYLDSESDLNVIAMDTVESELIGASVDISEEYIKNKKLAEKKQDTNTDAESSELSAKGSEATVADNMVNIKEISEMEESMMDMSITVQTSKTSDEVVGQTKDGFQASVSKNKKKKRKNKKYSDNGS